jgi:hypothetical protein
MSSCLKVYNNKGYVDNGESAMLPPAMLARRLWALRWQQPSGALSGATSSRSCRPWLRRHAATSYVDMSTLGTPSAMTLGYSLWGYLEPVMPPLATSSHSYQLR